MLTFPGTVASVGYGGTVSRGSRPVPLLGPARIRACEGGRRCPRNVVCPPVSVVTLCPSTILEEDVVGRYENLI